jgi:1,4-alpha-glucan branching enzyme
VAISSPAISPYFVDPGQDIIIEANANGAEQIHLYVDDVLTTSIAGNVLTYTLQASTATDTKSWIKVIAEGGGDISSDSVYYYVRGITQIEDLPLNVRDGINIIDDNTVTLVLLAPNKNSVFVHGDFNGWEIGPEFSMKRNTASPGDEWARYWVTIDGLNPGEEYAFQYIIDEELLIAAPYADKILDQANDPYITESVYPGLKDYPQGKTTGIVSVFETGQEAYEWQHNDFAVPQITDLVIYEMLVRDFTDAHTYAMVADTLDYLKELGINVLELMPVNEFEGNSSWGYNPSFYFAPDKYYGPKEELKRLIDACHARDIAVVLDIVLNHSYYQSPLVQMYFSGNKPSADNPWYNVDHNFANQDAHWGYDFDHSSEYTRNFVDSVNAYWMSEYHMDGFRFDFTKGFSNTWHGNDDPWGSNYDGARIFNLQRMSNEIWARNEDAIIIMEHLAENSEEIKLAEHGILLWGNHNYNYTEASMGYNDGGKSDFSGMSYQKRNWDDPHLVGYMESHDEERMMFKNISYGNSNGAYNITEPLYYCLR